MDPRLLDYYNQELHFIREMGTEFAQRFPKTAAALDLGAAQCADPYVERLLEGFAFLTARIQLKLDAEFPRFTQHLLEMIYPHYLAPVPSMTIVQVDADLHGGVSESGFLLPRHTVLRAQTGRRGRALCEFRTAHELMLWPISLSNVNYLPQGKAITYAGQQFKGVKAALQLRMQTIEGFTFQQLALDKLSFFLDGKGVIPMQLYELLLGHTVGIIVQPVNTDQTHREVLNKHCLQALGFEDRQALLPYGPRSFQGYRLLQEYFAMPERFLFIELTDLAAALCHCNSSTIEIVVLLDSERQNLEDLVSADNFALNCTPAINLFPKRADRILLNHRSSEHHLVVDKTRPNDYEVYSVGEVTGYSNSSIPEQVFQPFYAMHDGSFNAVNQAFYTIRRQPTLKPGSPVITGKSPYFGSEVYLSLVDGSESAYRSDLQQLGVELFCTNRDQPLFMMTGELKTDFTLKIAAPVNAVRCLVKPTEPKASHAEGEHAWRLISHLSLNYLTLLNKDEHQGAEALRELLQLYGDNTAAPIRKQIEGLLSINSTQVVRRIPLDGPMTFARGVEINLMFDEMTFEGGSAFLLAAVCERFFSKYVSLNSFTQTVAHSRERGEIMRWPVRTGTRTLI